MSEDKSKNFNLKPPEVPPVISMQSPEFQNLTSAEKLNDSEYRSLIYRAFPNEPICACSKDPRAHVKTFDRKCPGSCTNNCCNRTHPTVTITKNNADPFGNPRSGNHNTAHCPLNNGVRMRGGGCEDLYRKWEELDASRIPRAQHPANCPRTNNYGSPNYYYTTRTDRSLSEPARNPLNSSKCKTNPKSCGDSPCIGADCFLRTLRETQEFVDSLGRVPGLVGLGLEDPSESPYFRTKEFPSEDVETAPVKDQKKNRRSSKGRAHQKTQKTNDPVLIKTKPFTLPSSGKKESFQGSVLPSLDPYNLEKAEEALAEGTGPCGKSGCRSRRKIKPLTSSSHEIVKSKDKERRSSKRSFQRKRLNRRRNRGVVPVHGGEELRSARRRVKYVYLAGDTYPGVTFGHKNCNDPRKRVPANMGWLWNECQALGRLKPRVGWRPGAISRTMREIIRETRAGALEDTRSRSAHSRSRLKNRSQTSMKKTQSKRLDEEEEEEPPPTLHILRRDGTYYVTMYPIKQESMEVPQLEVPMKPLQFKIVKNKDDSESESSTASDIEIEFSPPAAVNRYKKKADVVHVDVQVKQQEILDTFKPAGEKKKERKGKKGKK
ncbi:uncharacterized protein LOC107041569 [Diachasma alloeum]|uniref:uncharacterized protein LOC107041569 n=1 Tax=Diachasma alloeum TaxID=454923 RepID=UPI0007383A29|nr:uncharacterized protein LOC107041569 [Diachasma alloeum]